MKSGLLTKIIIMSMIALLCLPFLPAQNAYAAVTYTVDIANTDETFTNLDSFATYAGAYEYFSQQTDMDTVIRDSSGKVYAMKQGMAITYSSDSTLTFTSKHDGNISAYCQNGYACYYVSTDSSQKVTIMISGYKGTCKVSDVILIPAAHMYPRCTSSNRFFVDYYLKDSDGDLRHYLSIYSSSSNSTYTAYITVDKAPSFMTVGEKYYSYDGFTYYTSPYDVVTGSNPAGTHIIYYKWLSYRSETSYTSEELDSFITYKNGSYRTSVQCAYLGLGSTFMEAQTIYGVNAAMELAFANHESAYGKSSFAVNNYNFFGVGAFDSNPSLASKYTDAQIGIIQHAKLYMTRGYMDAYAYIKTSLGTAYYDVPDRTKGYISSYAGDGRYFGSCPGNKAVGICVKYASDPFHGEKVAARMYEIDRYLGFKDYGKYTIGLTNTGAKAYASPDTSSWVLYKYTTKDPNRSSGSYSYGPAGMPVLILGETGDFYMIQSEMPMNADGYACNSWDYDHDLSVAYVLKSDIDIWFSAGVLDDVSPVQVDLDSDSFNIDKTLNMITGIFPGTTVESFTESFTNGTVKVFDGDNEVTEGLMCTNYIVKIYDTEEDLVTSYKAVVKGDVNGDGAVSVADVLILQKYRLGLEELSGAFYKAGDTNLDGNVSVADVLILQKYRLGMIELP